MRIRPFRVSAVTSRSFQPGMHSRVKVDRTSTVPSSGRGRNQYFSAPLQGVGYALATRCGPRCRSNQGTQRIKNQLAVPTQRTAFQTGGGGTKILETKKKRMSATKV